jgi:hypothetical protein
MRRTDSSRFCFIVLFAVTEKLVLVVVAVAVTEKPRYIPAGMYNRRNEKAS